MGRYAVSRVVDVAVTVLVGETVEVGRRVEVVVVRGVLKAVVVVVETEEPVNCAGQ